MVKKTIMALAGAAAMLAAMPAAAATFAFQLSGPVEARWEIDDAITPFADDADGVSYVQLPGAYDGFGANGVDVDLFSNINGGGLRVTDTATGDIIVWSGGSQLYAKPQGRLSFVPGSYTVQSFPGGEDVALTISAVPEPATWAMMALGLGATGFALRGRRRQQVVAA